MNKKTYILLLSALTISACKQDDSIKTYRLAKESAPLLAPMQNQTTPTDSIPPMMGGNGMQPLPGMAPAASAKEIEWKTPAGWKEQAPSSMRVGSFLITGENGEQADVSVIPLSGMAGGDLANVNRWRDQIELAALTEADLPDNIHSTKLNGHLFQIVNFVSDKPLIGGKLKKRVIAATLQQGERTWFFKMMGEDRTVQSSKQKFTEFLSSIKLKDGETN